MKWTKDAVLAETIKIYQEEMYAIAVAHRLEKLCATIQADMAAEIADLQEMLNVSDKAVAETILANQ